MSLIFPNQMLAANWNQLKQIYGYSYGSPLIDNTAGDNWFYYDIPGYEPGAGLGVLDVTKISSSNRSRRS